MVNDFSEQRLGFIQEEIDKLIAKSKQEDEDTSVYETLRKIVDLRITEKKLLESFDEFSEVTVAMAQLDFSRRMDHSESEDLFSYISASINLLNEELEANTVPRRYIEELINLIPYLVVITAHNGTIRFVNNCVEKITGFKGEELTEMPISTLLASDMVLRKINGSDRGPVVEDVEINLVHRDSSLNPVTLNVRELIHPYNEGPDYMYILKERKF